MNARTPSVNLEAIDRLVFVYDREDDLAFLHIDGPRSAISEQADDGWYLRVADGEAVGLELHGLKRIFLSSPFYSEVFRPAMREIEAFTGRSFESDDIRAEGSAAELHHTTHLLILLLGQAIEKLESVRHAQYEDAGRHLLAS